MSMRVTIGETNANDTPSVPNDHSQIRTGATNKVSVTLGGDGKIISELSGTQQVTSEPATSPTNPISTIRTAAGAPTGGDMTKVTDQSSITIGGNEMTIANGIHLGVLQRDAQGNISLSPEGEKYHQKHTQANTEATDKARQEAEANRPVNQQSAETMTRLALRGGQAVQGCVAEAVQAMVSQDAEAYNRAISEIETAAGAEGVSEFVAEYTNQAASSLTTKLSTYMGSDSDTIYDFAMSEIPARQLSQMITSYAAGDLSVIEHIKDAYGNKFRAWSSRRNSQ